MATTTKVQYGDNLKVTDQGGGVIRVDATGVIGAPSGDATFVFTQGSPSASWDIVHTLGKNPSVTVVDSGGSEVIPTVVYVDSSHITVTFGSPTSGRAYLN